MIEDASRALARTFGSAGDDIVLLGEGFGELGGSEYLKVVHGLVKGSPPSLDFDRERALIALLTKAAAAGLLQSAHDCSDGGIAITLAESAFESGGVGLEVDVPAAAQGIVATLFGESASRAVVTLRPANRQALMDMATMIGVPALAIGRTGGSAIQIAVAGEVAIECMLTEAEVIWKTSLERHFTGRAA